MNPQLATRIRVRTYELDSFGHVNNAVYLNYLEEARSEFLKALGTSFNEFQTCGVQLVIVEATIRYHSPARYGDEILVEGQFHSVGLVTLSIDYKLTELSTGRRIAVASTRGAFVDAVTGRPTRAPQRFREALQRAGFSG